MGAARALATWGWARLWWWRAELPPRGVTTGKGVEERVAPGDAVSFSQGVSADGLAPGVSWVPTHDNPQFRAPPATKEAPDTI